MNTATDHVPTTIDAATFLREVGTEAVLLDVRSDAEFAGRQIAGSYNFPLPHVRAHCDDLARRLDGPVVLICQTGARAEQAQLHLARAGVTGTRILAGGVSAFTAAGGETLRGRERWDLERQVRLVAGSLMLVGVIGGVLLSPWLLLLSAGIGAGLTASAATNTCMMGRALSWLPVNREAPRITATQALYQLPAPRTVDPGPAAAGP